MSDIAAISSLDLSRLPAPAVVAKLDYEIIRTDLIADFQARWPEFDALLESDPAIKLIEVAAYRELLLRARVNDAARSVMLAFAIGADLDQLGAFYGVARMVITPAAGANPAVLEDDTGYRRRLLLAPEAFASAGSLAAYEFHALSADARVLNVEVWTPAAGEVVVAVQARGGNGAAGPDLVESVRAYLHLPRIKPLTDMVSVRSVENIPFAIALEAFVRPGPSTALIRDEINASVEKMVAARRTPGRDMPRSAAIAAAQLELVDRVALAQPAADIARGHGEVALCTGIDVTVTTHAG